MISAMTVRSLLLLFPALTWVEPVPTPIDRLIPNLRERLQLNPTDAHAHYLLGRVHSLSAALKTGVIWKYESHSDELQLYSPLSRQSVELLRVRDPDGGPYPLLSGYYAPDPLDENIRQAILDEIETSKLLDSHAAAIHLLRNAVLLAPRSILCRIAYAHALESAVPFCEWIRQDALFGYMRDRSSFPYEEVERTRTLLQEGGSQEVLARNLIAVDLFRADKDPAVRERATAAFAHHLRTVAFDQYSLVFELARWSDLKSARRFGGSVLTLPEGLGRFASYEAAEAIVRLAANLEPTEEIEAIVAEARVSTSAS